MLPNEHRMYFFKTCKNVQNTNVVGAFILFILSLTHRAPKMKTKVSFFSSIWVAEQFKFFFFFHISSLNNISTGAKPILIRQFLIIILSFTNFELFIIHSNQEILTWKCSKIVNNMTCSRRQRKTFDTWFVQFKC